jgi:hypothetical protein
MKPDPAYIKRLLLVFQDFPAPAMDIRDIQAQGIPYGTDEFYFHLKLLNDQLFVERDDDLGGVGVHRSADGHLTWSVLPLRLTASGHEFAEAMSNNKAFEAVKKSFVSSSLGIMRDIAVTIFKGELARHGIDLGH